MNKEELVKEVAKKAKVNRMLNTRVKSSEFYNKVTGSAKKLKNY